MSSKRNLIFFHIIGCITFLLLPLLFFPSPTKSFNVFKSPPSQRDFLGQILLISFFYFSYFYVIPKFYFTKKYFTFFSFTLLCFLLIIFLPYLLLHPFHSQPPPFDRASSQDFQNNINRLPLSRRSESKGPFFGEISHHIFLFFACFFFSLNLRTSARLKLIQQEKTDAELSYLKAQINPHFLFNTLNSIYSLAIQKSDAAPDAIVKLSEMMRYVLHDSAGNFVPLKKEIAYITNYIELQLVRFNNAKQLKFEINGNSNDYEIAPLILMPFIENAFKYGINAEEKADIAILIDVKRNSLIMEVRNDKVNQNKFNGEPGGVGIKNTKDRLTLLYPAKHELTINDNEKSFAVILKLRLI